VDSDIVKIFGHSWYSSPVPENILLKGLNQAQKEAVLHTKGPLLIVAGAGAGKTKTITHRIAYLIEDGIPARTILAVTFTNKAAGEMRERIHTLTESSMPTVSTFHSLGVRILREFPKEAGVPDTFAIWDRDDSLRAIKRILDRLESQLIPKAVLARISGEKNKGNASASFAESARDFRERDIARVWHEYEKETVEEHALDFDDLLVKTRDLLASSEHVRGLLQNRWQHITVDEYQDTNSVQFEIVSFLAAPRNNICVVGDLDQAIYTWRHARLENLLEFEHSFPGTKAVTLEENYRSTHTIITAANMVIEKNVNRRPKKLVATKGVGEAIELYAAHNDRDEAYFVANKVAELIERGMRPQEVAVLYRENFQSRALEEAMLTFGVPYRVLGTRFFDRKEVKDVLSYVRVALNPKSRSDLTRIASVPPRGIGKVTLEKMVAELDHEAPTAARTKIEAFRKTLEIIKKGAETLPAPDAVRLAFEVSGMEALFKNQKNTEEGKERLGNVNELINFATRYGDEKPPEGTLRLLEDAALQSEQDQLEDKENAVSLMTVHASKGLEFDAIFVTGLEQGLFPSVRENDTTRDPEEERRLFYVALTRARERLFLSFANERMRYGSRELSIPSEFLEDIDPRLMVSAAREQPAYREDIIT